MLRATDEELRIGNAPERSNQRQITTEDMNQSDGGQRYGAVLRAVTQCIEKIPDAPSRGDVVSIAGPVAEPLSQAGDGRLKDVYVVAVVFWSPDFGE